MSTFESDALDPAAPVTQKARWEDCIDVFFAPRELFERRRHDKFGTPFIILLVLATAFYFILLPAQSMIIRAAMPPEALAKMGKMAGMMSIFGGITTPIMYAIMIAITALILWLLGKFVDGETTFPEMMLVATYAGYVFLLGSIASLIAVMIHGEAGLTSATLMKHMSFGVMRFVDASTLPKPVVALLARIDIFKIWQAVIWMIGFQVVTGATRSKAAIVAAGTWFLFAIPAMLGGGAAGKFGNVEIKTGD